MDTFDLDLMAWENEGGALTTIDVPSYTPHPWDKVINSPPVILLINLIAATVFSIGLMLVGQLLLAVLHLFGLALGVNIP